MKKMYRREYLKGMAIAVGGLGLGRLNPVPKGGIAGRTLANIAVDRASLLISPDVCPNSWPCINEPPDPNVGVRLIFSGMVAFTYKQTDDGPEGRAVFHRGDEHHKLKIIAYQGSYPHCSEIYRNEDIAKKVTMDVRVNGRSSDAKFFMSTTPFKREDLQGHD